MGNPTWTMNIQRSCPVLYFHFFWGLSLVILGWTTFAARWIPAIKPYHRRMGQIWAYGMIIQIYTSTYCSYNGFRWFIFMFGVICYVSLIIGHSFIRKLQLNIRNKKQNGLLTATQLKIFGDDSSDKSDSPDGDNNGTITEIVEENNENIINNIIMKPSWFTQKRLKTLHGIFMVISLVMVTGAGAAFTTRFASTQECKNIYCETDGDGWIPVCFVQS